MSPFQNLETKSQTEQVMGDIAAGFHTEIQTHAGGEFVHQVTNDAEVIKLLQVGVSNSNTSFQPNISHPQITAIDGSQYIPDCRRTAGVEAASLDTTGIIRVVIDNQVVRAMVDFTILPGAAAASAAVNFEFIGDRNGDGIDDFLMTFPNGDRQLL